MLFTCKQMAHKQVILQLVTNSHVMVVLDDPVLIAVCNHVTELTPVHISSIPIFRSIFRSFVHHTLFISQCGMRSVYRHSSVKVDQHSFYGGREGESTSNHCINQLTHSYLTFACCCETNILKVDVQMCHFKYTMHSLDRLSNTLYQHWKAFSCLTP